MERRRTRQPLPLTPAPLGRAPVSVATASARPALPAGIDLAETRRFERGRTVVAQGSSAGELFVVREGLLREAAVSADGRWFVHALLGAGDVFGTTTPATIAPATVRTLSSSTLGVISSAHLDQLFAQRPDLAPWLMAGLERRAIRAQRTVHDLAWSDAAVRLRRRLLALATEHGRRTLVGVRVEVPVTQEDLGAMIGATRETVNRTLVGFIASGFLRVERRRYVLLHPFIDSLADEAEGEP